MTTPTPAAPNAGPENNTLLRARQAVGNNEDCDVERINVLISTITDANTKGAQLVAQREALGEQAKANGKVIEDAYAELETLLPTNPLGNLSIGAV